MNPNAAAHDPTGMKVTLLTHFKGFEKRSNTGQLVVEMRPSRCAGTGCSRRQAAAEIAAGGVALIYPGATDEDEGSLADISHVILIDGTWHEARKIYQRSPYLRQVRVPPNKFMSGSA